MGVCTIVEAAIGLRGFLKIRNAQFHKTNKENFGFLFFFPISQKIVLGICKSRN